MNVGDFNKRVLLTGAGFSKNFGGFLASEFTERLVSKVRKGSFKLRELVNLEPNYEVALVKARKGALQESDVRALEQAILEVYIDQDDVHRTHANADRRGINIYRFQRFLSKFAKQEHNTSGFLFTLNQDLLVEHEFYNFETRKTPHIPGIANPGIVFTTSSGNSIEDQRKNIVVSYDQVKSGNIDIPHQFNYIKLHGSFNWRTPDDNSLLIIGGNKAKAIEDNPLLAFYQQVFKDVCKSGNIQLMCIGYGFWDEHINIIIADAIKNHGLEIWVWDSKPKAQWVTEMTALGDENADRRRIGARLSGYITNPFQEIFSKGDSMSDKFDPRIEDFFID